MEWLATGRLMIQHKALARPPTEGLLLGSAPPKHTNQMSVERLLTPQVQASGPLPKGQQGGNAKVV